LTQYSKKFRDNELNENFTLEKTFGVNGEILIPPQNLNLLPRYNTEFVGWNLIERSEFYEDVGEHYPNGSIAENIQAARDAADALTVIKYDSNTQTYSLNNNFDFATAFSDSVDTLNFYPTFVATVQSYEVTFYDGLTDNNNGYGEILTVNIDGVAQNT
jgi:hypothetical protein